MSSYGSYTDKYKVLIGTNFVKEILSVGLGSRGLGNALVVARTDAKICTSPMIFAKTAGHTKGQLSLQPEGRDGPGNDAKDRL